MGILRDGSDGIADMFFGYDFTKEDGILFDDIVEMVIIRIGDVIHHYSYDRVMLEGLPEILEDSKRGYKRWDI